MIKIEDLQSYLIEFEKDDKIKPKIYILDCVIGRNN